MPAEVWRFEDFELDPNAYRLRHKDRIVRLERIPFELLCLLVERRGELVNREEILERVWGKGVFVDGENSINTAVRKIRRALNDDADAPRFIVTVPAHGYRFVAPLSEDQNGAVGEAAASTAAETAKTEKAARRYWSKAALFSVAGLAMLAAAVLVVQHFSLRSPYPPTSTPRAEKPARPALPLPDRPSIAVLPFANMSGDPQQEYFSDGITDELTTALSRLQGLFVIARSSAFTYKGKAVKVQDVSRDLGVRYVLEGSVRKSGNTVRITAQLVDASTGDHLWAEHYDRPLRDIFSMQDEIVRRIVTTLNLQLTLAQQGFLVHRTTENLEAYDDLLRGREYWSGLTRDGNAKARQMFEKAIALDPKYAIAYADLGRNYLTGWAFAFDPDPNDLRRALHLEQQAITLDESLADAHSALAQIYSVSGQTDQAFIEVQRSLALDPNSALSYRALANTLNSQFKPVEALAAVEKGMRLDPRNPDYYLYFQQGFAYTQLGRYEDAIPLYQQCLVRYPDFLAARRWLILGYVQLGQEGVARVEAAAVERRVTLNPNSHGYAALAFVRNVMAEHVQALEAVEKAMRLDPANRDDSYLVPEGWAYEGLGQYEDSITAFKRYLDRDQLWALSAHLGLAIDYVEVGRDDAARAEASEAVRLNPHFNLEMVYRTLGPKGKVLAENKRWIADLRKAGLK